MGVRGLTTYVNVNQDLFLQKFLLHDSCLVIDGNSMCARLYGCIRSFSAFGGDYDKFASYVKMFLKNFRKCNISPYVIFDGSHERRKLRTAFSRLRSKISGACRLDPVTQDCLQIFPLLIRDTFKEVLQDMGIPFTVCEFEADDEIAAMARYLNCPVLSYDSDFFIYNVLYIPFNTVEHSPTQIDDGKQKKYGLKCKIYKVDFLAKTFGYMGQENMLPLLATLLGNDYVEKRVFRKFFSELKLPKSKKCKNEQQRAIHGIFNWLKHESVESAIAKILGRCKKRQKNMLFNIIMKSIAGYHKKNCRSLKFFNICDGDPQPEIAEAVIVSDDDEDDGGDDDDDRDDDEESTSNTLSDDDDDLQIDDKIDSSDGNENVDELKYGLPLWFADKIRMNLIPSAYLNLYTHHLHFSSPQAEDYTDEDSFLCTLPIMRYGFDILTDFFHENCLYVSRNKTGNVKKVFVTKEYATTRLLDVPFEELSNEQLNLYFHHFLKEKMPSLDLNDLSLLPSNFQMFMLSMLWWIQNCNVPLANIHSLLICYIMLDVIDEKTGTFRGHKSFTKKFSKRIEEFTKNPTVYNFDGTQMFLNKNKVQYQECLIAATELLNHFEMDKTIQKKPKSYDVKRIHSFAQFQCCLQQLNALNVLCGSPLQSTKYHKSYNGTFAYNIALKLENEPEPIIFFEQHLKGATTILLFYKSLCNVFNMISEKMSLTIVISDRPSKKTKRRKKKKESDEVDDLINKFFVEGFDSQVAI